MSHAPKDPNERREDVLLIAVEEQCATAGDIAHCLDYPVPTVRRDLETMEELGFVRGIKHDERDTLPRGRCRVYWSATDRGKGLAAAIKARHRRLAALDEQQERRNALEMDGTRAGCTPDRERAARCQPDVDSKTAKSGDAT